LAFLRPASGIYSGWRPLSEDQRMFRIVSRPFLRWWVLSFLLHLAVIGCLLLGSRLRADTPGVVQVVLVSLSDGRAGTGPAGGGARRFAPKEAAAAPGSDARKSGRTAGQKPRATAETTAKQDEMLAKPEIAKPPSGKREKEAVHSNISQKRDVQTKDEHSTTRPLASAAPAGLPSRPRSREDMEEGSVPPEGGESDGTDAPIITTVDHGEGERLSASLGGESSHHIRDLGGGPGWGRGGGYGSGVGAGTGPGAGLGGGGGTDWRLLILERIHRAKRYPSLARQWGMEGTAEVEFRIAGDGSVEDVTLVKSSGFPLLDRASVETIKQAAPLPVIPGTIRIPISYRLRSEE